NYPKEAVEKIPVFYLTLTQKGQNLYRQRNRYEKQQAAHSDAQTCCFSFLPLFKIPLLKMHPCS
ncbi:MAG: hypothetical protein ACLUYS_08170, partial [Allobaculum sp.]|uniref:hypothetical protein n=1 Tax=Allobaculum sp. TaxID=1872463 RepID=UPI003999ED15